jgi:hypothetical protein
MNAPLPALRSRRTAVDVFVVDADATEGVDILLDGDAGDTHGWSDHDAVALCAVGFTADERARLDAIAEEPVAGAPSVRLVPTDQAHLADVVMIDGADEAAMGWSSTKTWLVHRTVFWVDSKTAYAGQPQLHRPLDFAELPAQMVRLLREAPHHRATAMAARQAQDVPVVMVMTGDGNARSRLRLLLEEIGRAHV